MKAELNSTMRHVTLTLRKLVQNKRIRIVSKGIMLLHANTWRHAGDATQKIIQQFSWKQFKHPRYSLDLAPSDFYLFLHMKRCKIMVHFIGGKFLEK